MLPAASPTAIDARWARTVEAWLPVHDPDAQALILALLGAAAAGGGNPFTALSQGVQRWFGARASVALPRPRNGVTLADTTAITLESSAPHRPPTMWPQRPKRRIDELFSSWLWRTAVAAGAPPRCFARDALGSLGDDIDRDVAPVTVQRLAQFSGQTFEHLAGGALFATSSAVQETPAGLAEDALLHDGRFLLSMKGTDRQRRPRPVLQYCPHCLESDERPYFRRGWRFVHAAICLDHGCLLHDRCSECGNAVRPLALTSTDTRPCCASCGARLDKTPAVDAMQARSRQRALNAMLCYLATAIAPAERFMHFDPLARLFHGGIPLRDRARIIARVFGPRLGRIGSGSHGAVCTRRRSVCWRRA